MAAKYPVSPLNTAPPWPPPTAITNAIAGPSVSQLRRSSGSVLRASIDCTVNDSIRFSLRPRLTMSGFSSQMSALPRVFPSVVNSRWSFSSFSCSSGPSRRLPVDPAGAATVAAGGSRWMTGAGDPIAAARAARTDRKLPLPIDRWSWSASPRARRESRRERSDPTSSGAPGAPGGVGAPAAAAIIPFGIPNLPPIAGAASSPQKSVSVTGWPCPGSSGGRSGTGTATGPFWLGAADPSAMGRRQREVVRPELALVGQAAELLVLTLHGADEARHRHRPVVRGGEERGRECDVADVAAG